MQYQGMVFRTEFDKGRKSGVLTVELDRIYFSSDDFSGSLPLSNINIKLGGAADRIVFFSNPCDRETTFCTSDKEILKDEILNNRPDCSAAIKSLKHRKRKSKAVTFVTLLFIAVFISLPFVFSDAIFGLAAKGVPAKWERKFGELAFDAVTADKRMIEDELLDEQLAEIYAPLLDVVKESHPDIEFDFYIIEDSTLNAFALPGGKVVIHSGLLLASERPEEIAALLAHEISHVTCRHHIKGALKRAGLFAVIGVVLGDLSSLEQLATYGGSLVALTYSRKAEYEADETGWEFIREAGIDPSGFIDLFQRFKDREKMPDKAKDVMSLISTHPATEQRIEKLKNKNRQLPDDLDYYQFDLDYSEFKDNLAIALK